MIGTPPHPSWLRRATSAEGFQLRQHSSRTGDKIHNSPPDCCVPPGGRLFGGSVAAHICAPLQKGESIMKNHISKLNRYQKALLLGMALMIVVFAGIYVITANREG